MKKSILGNVLGLYLSQIDKRVQKNQIIIDNSGVLDDKFYGKDVARSVLISSKHSYTLAQENNIDVEYGKLGENILVDCNLYHLDIGSQIQIGDIILEISQSCTLCKSLSKIDNKLPKLLKNDRGVFTKVIKNGIVNENDKIYLLNH